MVKTILSYGNSRLIALICAAEQDLGNICRCFYDEFRTSDRCPYVAQYRGPRLEMWIITEKMMGRMPPTPRPCRIHAANGGRPLPKGLPPYDSHCSYSDSYNICLSLGKERKSRSTNIYYYDFAVISECENVDSCVDAFLHRMGLREIEGCSSYMSAHELRSIMKQ